MTRKDLLLLVLAAGEGKALSPIQLQKSLFLVQENCPGILEGPFYAFEPHNYGPFCKDIYREVESADLLNFVKVHRKMGQSWRDYSVTNQGIEAASKLQVRDEIKRYIREVVDWVISQPFDELVRAIYHQYPRYKVNSIFKG
jgi:uncharacterized protein YwgA